MSQRVKRATEARCVECDSRIYFSKPPGVGQVVTCRACGTKLAVIEVDPIELDWYEYDEDDYDDDDEEYN